MKLRHKFLWSLTGLFLGFALLLIFVATRSARAAHAELYRGRIQVEADMLAADLARFAGGDLQGYAVDAGRRLDLRVTLIAADGVVLGDSSMDLSGLSGMDNHGRRPEIVQARQQGAGESVRHSASTGVDYLYTARRVEGNPRVAVIRLATPVSRMETLPAGFLLPLLITFFAAFLLLAVIAYFLVRRPSHALEAMRAQAARMAEREADAQMAYAGDDEIGQLAAEVNRMKRKLESRIEDLTTQRRRASSVISQMREGLLVVDHERRILFGNPTFERIFRLDREPEGRLLAEVIRVPTVIRDVDMALNEGKEVRESIFQATDSGQTFEQHVSPLLSPDGETIQGAVILFFDITRLEALESVRRDFVANVSHELRTPLTSIKAFVETLVEDRMEDRESSLEFLGIVRKHTARMEELIDDLTDLSLIETDSIELDLQEVDAHELTGEVADQMGHRYPGAQVDLAVELAAPFPMRADRRRLEQVLLNLVDNAVKFSRPGGEVRIRGLRTARGTQLRIEDDGVGIPADSLEKVFHRFYRVDRARSREVGGTGLGLAIVKHLVRLHGGTVGVESELGKGSTFLLDFPSDPAGT